MSERICILKNINIVYIYLDPKRNPLHRKSIIWQEMGYLFCTLKNEYGNLRPLGGLVGKCTICLVLEKDVSHMLVTEMLAFQVSGFRSETL